MAKKKYTKCECCPYYAKNPMNNKWECSKFNPYFYDDREEKYIQSEYKKSCIFTANNMDASTKETALGVLNRWINANKE